MKKGLVLSVLLLTSLFSYSHEYNHYADLFAQILFPIALFGCLVSVPLSFLVVVSKFDKKVNQLLYGGYSIAALLFFALLRFLYSLVHNHFELTCQVIAVGLYLSIFTLFVYISKLIYFKYFKKTT